MIKNLNKFNLKETDIKKKETIQEIINGPPLLIQTEVHFKKILINNKVYKKGERLCMSLGMFQKLEYDKNKNRLLRPYNKPIPFHRYKGENLNNKRLLIWRGGGYGDLLFIQPIIQYIKYKYPTCFISFAGGFRFLPIIKSYPPNLINSTIDIPFKISTIYDYDYHIIFEGSLERCIEAKDKNCYDIMNMMANVDINYKDYPLRLVPDISILNPSTPKEPFIVFQWRASSEIRSLSIPMAIKIINIILNNNFKVVMIDRPEFSYLNNSIVREFNNKNVINIKNSIDINHAISVISQADGVVGIDSSFLHIGESLNKPILGLFGPFKGYTRLEYYRNRDWIEPILFPCKTPNCNFHGDKKQCPELNIKMDNCLSYIKLNEFEDKFKKLFIEKGNKNGKI